MFLADFSTVNVPRRESAESVSWSLSVVVSSPPEAVFTNPSGIV